MKQPRFTFHREEDFQEVLFYFKEHRKKLKKPLTDYAELLTICKLEDMFGDRKDMAIKSMEQSMELGYLGVFPLKDDFMPQRNDPFKTPPRIERDAEGNIL